MALPELVDSALAIAKATMTVTSSSGGYEGGAGGGMTVGAEAALMALEALASCTPQEREANR